MWIANIYALPLYDKVIQNVLIPSLRSMNIIDPSKGPYKWMKKNTPANIRWFEFNKQCSFSNIFHVPENGHSETFAPESGQKKEITDFNLLSLFTVSYQFIPLARNWNVKK